MFHPEGELKPAPHPPRVRPDGIQDENRECEEEDGNEIMPPSERPRTRKFKPGPDGTLGKISVTKLDNTLAMMANEASKMWEQLVHFERSQVNCSRVNASLIAKLTAVIFDLEGDADSIKMYKENNKDILTWRICASGKRQLWMSRTHFEMLYRRLMPLTVLSK